MYRVFDRFETQNPKNYKTKNQNQGKQNYNKNLGN